MSKYDQQHRGSAAAYEQYLRSMNASMRQKVALTAAHLLCEGNIADMGMGSGDGSMALASLYADLEVVGVDINPEMVRRAQERHQLPNLSFVVGDIARPSFPDGSRDAILNSSVLHHVTSFSGYDRSAAARALEVQARQLRDGGVLIVRDFLDPGPGDVLLDLPADDDETIALFHRFSDEFRSLSKTPGFTFRERPAPDGWRRFQLTHTLAVEFVLRKDYRSSWDIEVQEEYTFATQAELEATIARIGLRLLVSTPLHNPWIIANRFRGRFRLWTLEEALLDYPATNHILVGQKVAPDHGVTFSAAAVEPIDYLEMTHWRHRETGQVLDLIRRPNTTIDVIPWFVRSGTVHLLARRSYPRPILGCHPQPLDGSRSTTWITEPLNVQQGDKPLGQTVEELLVDTHGLRSEQLRSFSNGIAIYPSPGGLQETVRSVLVEVDPINLSVPIQETSGFSTSGTLRAMEARQLLRAAQVGAMPDARLELNAYELLARLGLDHGPWIGAELVLQHRPAPPDAVPLEPLLQDTRRRYQRVPSGPDFLQVRTMAYTEHSADGRPLARQVLEHAVPNTFSANTVAIALLWRHDDTIFIGLEQDDVPAAQCFVGNSNLLTAPAWRLPHGVSGRQESRRWLTQRLGTEYGLEVHALWALGGRYHPSPGATPETVYPLAASVSGPAHPDLHWVNLRAVLGGRESLRDGHLRVVLMRTAHALGILKG